jgi:hypothetical protein
MPPALPGDTYWYGYEHRFNTKGKAGVLSNNPQSASAMMPHDSVSLLAHL